MSRLSVAGVARAAVVLGSMLVFPFVFTQTWLLNMAFFTLMYAGLAASWNLLGGYSGYISLGHVAFFGIGAYSEAILFHHIGIGSNGLLPLLVVPLIGLAVGLVSVPVAWVALRTRHMTFAIVTLTLLFVVQDLAFNLRGLPSHRRASPCTSGPSTSGCSGSSSWPCSSRGTFAGTSSV